MKDAIPPCIAKQSANRGMLSADEKKALKDYCSCHASVMGSNITKEEMLQVSKGSLPNSLPPKIKEAQKRCVEALLK